MATLIRHPKSRYWWTQFFDRNGKRISRSTGKIKKSEARDVAHSLEIEEKRAKQKQHGLQTEMLELFNRATVEANKGSFTVEKARSYVMELYQIVNHEELPSFTVGEWLDKWLKNKASDIKSKTMTRYSSSIASVKKALGKDANLRLELFTTQHATALRQKLIKKQARTRNATVNVNLTDFKSAITAAYEQQLIQYNVGLAIKFLPEDDSKIVTHFEPEEVQQLMRATDREDWKLAILLAAETGLRLSDVVGLKTESVKFDRRCLIVSPKKQMRAKNKKTILVPIHEATMNRLKGYYSSKNIIC